MYAAPDGLLLVVASDRVSAYDQVLPTPIPDKGRVLTALSVWWFERLSDLVPHHLVVGRRPGDPGRVAGPGDAGAPAGDAAGGVRRPRLPDRLRPGVVPGHRRGLRRAAAARARGRVPAAGAGLHADDQGAGRRARRGDDLPGGRGGGRPGAGGAAAGADAGRLPAGRRDRRRARHPAGRHQARVRPGRRGRADRSGTRCSPRTRRAGGRPTAGSRAGRSPRTTSSSCATGCPRTGTGRASRRRCRRRSSSRPGPATSRRTSGSPGRPSQIGLVHEVLRQRQPRPGAPGRAGRDRGRERRRRPELRGRPVDRGGEAAVHGALRTGRRGRTWCSTAPGPTCCRWARCCARTRPWSAPTPRTSTPTSAARRSGSSAASCCRRATVDGRISVAAADKQVWGVGDEHHVQARALSITQSTELGTRYPLAAVRELADWAHGRGLFVHMDGARLANAAAGLGVSLGEASAGCGVDVLSFGGTKNGGLGAEAVVVLRPGPGRGPPVPAQAGDAAGLEDAVRGGAVRRAADRRPVAAQRAAGQRDRGPAGRRRRPTYPG